MFPKFMQVLEAVARLDNAATVGQVEKICILMSRGQVERVLRQLQKDDYVTSELQPYGNTGRRVWSITDKLSTNIMYLNRDLERAQVVK